MLHLLQLPSSLDGQIAALPGVEGISSGVEEVAAHSSG